MPRSRRVVEKEIPAEIQLQSAQRELVRLKTGAVNAGFIQVSEVYIDEMNDLAQHAPSAHRVLWTLIKEMNKQNAVMISQHSLCRLTRLSSATVKRSVALLREQQWLEVLKMGTANIYRVNSSVVWQDREDGRRASFNAHVILNFDEQDNLTKAMPNVRTRHIPFVETDDSIPAPRKGKGSQLNLMDEDISS
ncbi:MAG: replication/maintenance protein RepL [Herminiimonas sp.]|nr:replication/maintenance protein RepL [Herminiimonas sp.]